MKTIPLKLIAALAFALACHAQIDEPTLVLSHPLGMTIPGVGISVPLIMVPPNGSFEFTMGDITVDETTESSELTLNSASLVMTSGRSDFSGVQHADLEITPPSNSDLETKTVATYDRSRDPVATKTLKLNGTAEQVNLLPYLETKKLRVRMIISGQAPSSDWTGDLELDVHVLGKVTFP